MLRKSDLVRGGYEIVSLYQYHSRERIIAYKYKSSTESLPYVVLRTWEETTRADMTMTTLTVTTVTRATTPSDADTYVVFPYAPPHPQPQPRDPFPYDQSATRFQGYSEHWHRLDRPRTKAKRWRKSPFPNLWWTTRTDSGSLISSQATLGSNADRPIRVATLDTRMYCREFQSMTCENDTCHLYVIVDG